MLGDAAGPGATSDPISWLHAGSVFRRPSQGRAVVERGPVQERVLLTEAADVGEPDVRVVHDPLVVDAAVGPHEETTQPPVVAAGEEEVGLLRIGEVVIAARGEVDGRQVGDARLTLLRVCVYDQLCAADTAGIGSYDCSSCALQM